MERAPRTAQRGEDYERAAEKVRENGPAACGSQNVRAQGLRGRQISGFFAKPFPMMGPVGLPVGEPPAGSSVIS